MRYLSNNPWWTVYGGIGDERTLSAKVSPFNISVEVLGKPVIVPMLFYLMLFYLTMAARLSILLAAATTLIPNFLTVAIVIAGNVNKIVASIAPAFILDYSSMMNSSCPAVDGLS